MSGKKTAAEWVRRQRIPDAQVRDAADQYDAARELLEREPPEVGVLLPLINTAAVAIELYLKCLCSEVVHTPADEVPGLWRVTAAPERGHGLTKLFEAIPKDVQVALEHSFAAEKAGSSFRDALAKCDGAFVASRYPFELESDLSRYDVGRLMEVSRFMARFVADHPPTESIRWK
jgi:hypothetical protein